MSTGVSQLPNGWAPSSLGKFRSDMTTSVDPTQFPSEKFDLYSIPAHDEGTFEHLHGREIGSTKKLLSPGTVVLSKINPRISRVGVVGPDRGYRQLGSSEWIPFSPITGIDPSFLAYALRQESVRSHLASNVSGVGGSLMRTNATILERVPLLLPPSAEQRRIAEVLDSYFSRLDAAVASLERAQARLKAYRASVLKAAVEGRLVPTEADLARAENRDYEPADVRLKRILAERRKRWEQAELRKLMAAGKAPNDDKWKRKYEEPVAPDESSTPKLPEGWCWATVDQVGDVLLGRQRAPQFLTGRWSRPYLRVANIKDDRIDFQDVGEMDFDEGHFEKYQLKPGDILVSEGQSPHLCGQSAIYRGGVEGLCFQKTLHRFRPIDGGPSSEFAQVVFRAHVRLGVYQAVASITTNIAHLTLEKFKQSRFPLPPTSEEACIVMETQRVFSVADSVERQMALETTRVARLRQAVLKWAFEGKLLDQDPNDEPAEDLLFRIRADRAAAPPRDRLRGRRVKAGK